MVLVRVSSAREAALSSALPCCRGDTLHPRPPFLTATFQWPPRAHCSLYPHAFRMLTLSFYCPVFLLRVSWCWLCLPKAAPLLAEVCCAAGFPACGNKGNQAVLPQHLMWGQGMGINEAIIALSCETRSAHCCVCQTAPAAATAQLHPALSAARGEEDRRLRNLSEEHFLQGDEFIKTRGQQPVTQLVLPAEGFQGSVSKRQNLRCTDRYLTRTKC